MLPRVGRVAASLSRGVGLGYSLKTVVHVSNCASALAPVSFGWLRDSPTHPSSASLFSRPVFRRPPSLSNRCRASRGATTTSSAPRTTAYTSVTTKRVRSRPCVSGLALPRLCHIHSLMWMWLWVCSLIPVIGARLCVCATFNRPPLCPGSCRAKVVCVVCVVCSSCFFPFCSCFSVPAGFSPHWRLVAPSGRNCLERAYAKSVLRLVLDYRASLKKSRKSITSLVQEFVV